ncbi:MAG: carbonic anhydrase [Synechococcales cyanobacterium CRU_2_2]|nr:carbonic anhydrase [Synechococcales cyanobacterium CRU_2_2]
MKKLIRGLQEFQEHRFDEYRGLFEQLAHGQKPKVLFITCSDSRIVPNLLTQTEPGELFVVRNAGNIVPPYGAANGGEGATIEYAVHALGINQVVICGHSHCGAMKGLLKLNQLRESMPLVCQWLEHAAGTLRVLQDSYAHLEGEELIETAVAENILTQIDNLKTYPVIHSRLHQGKMKIHGWIYEFETGNVLSYDRSAHAFVPPSTQLVKDDDEGVILPGQYVNTSAPPVDAAVPSPVSAERSGSSGAPWLSQEQAKRIYQGNGLRR